MELYTKSNLKGVKMCKKLIKIMIMGIFIFSFNCKEKKDGYEIVPIYSPIHDEATWSPDGKKIAYVVTPTGTNGYPEIWIMDIETGEKRFLCYGEQPDFSPDGKKIVFVDAGICIININGDSLVRLTHGRGVSPHWTPEGKRIVFWSGQKIRTIKIDGTDEKILISEDKKIGEVDWSPVNPNQLVCSGSWYIDTIPREAIFISDTLGENRVLLFVSDNIARYPEWSPDGKKVVFSGELYNQQGCMGSQIYVVNADGTGLKQLTTEGGDQPYWSPDGKKIVYTRINILINPEEDPRNGYLWVMDADGSNKKQLTFPGKGGEQ